MMRSTQILGMSCVVLAAAFGEGCSFHAEWHAGKSSGTQGQTAGAERVPAPEPTESGGRRHGVRVSLTPHHGNKAGATDAAQTPAPQHASGSAAAPLALPQSQPAQQGSGSAAVPLVLPSPAPVAEPARQASGSAAVPLVLPTPAADAAPAADTASSGRAERITAMPTEPGASVASDAKPVCRPLSITARVGEVLRLRVANIPETAEARLNDRPLTVISRSGQAWGLQIPADASSGLVTLVDAGTVYRCGRISTAK